MLSIYDDLLAQPTMPTRTRTSSRYHLRLRRQRHHDLAARPPQPALIPAEMPLRVGHSVVVLRVFGGWRGRGDRASVWM